jgi:hypothetical protein
VEKYGTYQIWENLETGEIKRIPYGNEESLEKVAHKINWIRRMDLEYIEKENPS